MLAFPAGSSSSFGGDVTSYQGPKGPLANFLRDFGPALLKKYKPKGIVVFSAHWETSGERLGTHATLSILVLAYHLRLQSLTTGMRILCSWITTGSSLNSTS